MNRSLIASGLVISLIGLNACSGTPSVDSTTSVGGSTSSGGASSIGGVSSGGTSSTGGASSINGTSNIGGAPSTGGSAAIGGASSTTTGGLPSTGGVPSTGGTSSTGGSSATGGAVSTGGTLTTGGSSSTGGTSTATCTGSRWATPDTGTANQIKLAFGSGTSFPQYAVLYTNDSYLRFVYGPSGGWGSSIILAPTFWAADGYHQGATLNNVQTQIDCDKIQLSFTGNQAGLSFSGTLKIDAPTSNQVTAHVSMTTTGTVTLATNRPGETFKPVMISTMYESTTVWDAQSAIIGGSTYPLPTSGWVVPSPIAATHFGVVGGSSSWKTNAPTVVIDLAGVASPAVTGWMTQSSDPNADNGSLWAATTQAQSSWSYDLTVTP